MSDEEEEAEDADQAARPAAERTDEPCSRHVCYVLRNSRDARTYVGYTVDPARRLRQHNGDLVGGARYTTALHGRSKVDDATKHVWDFLAIVESPGFDAHRALSFEWHAKRPTRQRRRPPEFSTPEGRLRSVARTMMHPKFRGLNFVIRVAASFSDVAARVTAEEGVVAERVVVQPLLPHCGSPPKNKTVES